MIYHPGFGPPRNNKPKVDHRTNAKSLYYLKFSKLFLISMLSMLAGAQVVHYIFKPDLVCRITQNFSD